MKRTKRLYEGVVTSVRITCGEKSFSRDHSLYQGSALSPYLSTLIIYVLITHIQKEVPRSKLFANDIVLVDKSRDRMNVKT